MEKCYDVKYGAASVGKAQVTRQGLYYHIVCRCKLPEDTVFRACVRCGENTENLGVLVPEGDGFVLDTHLPVKRLGEGEMLFSLVTRNEKHSEGTFVPIYPEEPFAYIERLKQAYLAYQNGQIGAVFSEPEPRSRNQSSSSRPTGQ